MKANELMIGDWVKSRGKIEQVKSVYDGFICTDSFEDSHDYYFEPIPLTPEILEKNGFELGGILKNTYSVGDSNYTITIDKKGRGQCDIMNHLFYIGVTMKCCGTVHELQNAIRHCKIDKTIEL